MIITAHFLFAGTATTRSALMRAVHVHLRKAARLPGARSLIRVESRARHIVVRCVADT